MIFNIGSGSSNKLPVLDTSYPLDENVDVGEIASFEVKIAEPGKPAEYTYQWYYDGSAVEGATGITYSRVAEVGEHSVYCMVTTKAGAVKSRVATVGAESLYLFKDGNEFTEITGGWVRSGNNGTIENTGTSLKITVPGGYKSGGAKLVNMFDLTDYNAIECDWSGDNSLKLYVQKDGTDVASGKTPIDISAITGMCSLRIYTESSGSTIDVLEFTYLRLTK
jgi:hypothetical protein